MFTRLLVPLDGSRLAESALPAAAELAVRLQAPVVLLHVLESGPPPTVHGDRHVRTEAEARAYLDGAVEWMGRRGVTARGVVCPESGGVAATIARQAEAAGVDLIVLTSHGRGGVRGLLYGRVAEQVLQRGRTPVLLLPPSERGRDAPFTCQRILVPLDGSEAAETAVEPGIRIAAACGADLLLVWVVPTVDTISDERAPAARLMPTAAAALLDVEAREAAAYLEGVAARVRAAGIAARAAVERGEPVQVLLETAARERADLIVMATHGRSGVSALWAGSVASRVIGAGRRPVLLIRVPRT
ncbi:MAG: universal stress protein [Armatimonadota bacterium]|nr:universal stress protein [Armatimonadota bacterium]MDR7402158.1 universal stress protein [Armatimonadota bacterium]MDR7404673.1 universal stress protein [Armatimonadota bacterium]MDR7436915.1 universal stress protein [Armatimonadota bacterium]MDR7472311.1 universal stress protein [Armatimonadota bacterium]